MADILTTISDLLTNWFRDGQKSGSIKASTLRTAINSLAPPETVVAYAPSVSWNMSTDPVAKITLTGNVTINVSGGEAGRAYRLRIIQSGAGSNTVALSGVTVLGSAIYRTAVNSINILQIDVVGTTLVALVV